MAKKVFLCFLLLIMTGCAKVDSDIKIWIKDYIIELSKENFEIVNNHKKKYYNYYVPSNISNIESTDTHNVFVSNNVDIIMNLDISSIINRKLYNIYDVEKSTYNDDYLVYANDRASFLKVDYRINIYDINKEYLVEIRMNNMILVSLIRQENVKNIIRQMLILGASVRVDEDKVIKDFSSKDIVDYKKEQVDLFEMIIPKDGLLSELIDPGSIDKDDIKQDINTDINSNEATKENE